MKLPNPSLRHYHFLNENKVIFQANSHKLVPEPIFDMHLPLELGVVLSGKMARYNDGIYTELPRGGIWLAGILEPHGRQALIADSKVAVFIISADFFYETVIPGVDNFLWQSPFNTPAKDRPLLINEEFACLAERLSGILNKDDSHELHAAQTQITLLEIILHMHRLGSFKVAENAMVTDLGRLRPAFEFIYRSSEQIGPEDAARLCKLSLSRFSQLFVKATGLSFSKFSLRYRLSRVAQELKNNTNSLDALADEWGFSDKSHLVHRFKECYNVTPSMYRNHHQPQ